VTIRDERHFEEQSNWCMTSMTSQNVERHGRRFSTAVATVKYFVSAKEQIKKHKFFPILLSDFMFIAVFVMSSRDNWFSETDYVNDSIADFAEAESGCQRQSC
jgi:hypothetical protein